MVPFYELSAPAYDLHENAWRAPLNPNTLNPTAPAAHSPPRFPRCQPAAAPWCARAWAAGPVYPVLAIGSRYKQVWWLEMVRKRSEIYDTKAAQ